MDMTSRNEDKENLIILCKYLTDHYGSDQARELLYKHREHLFDFRGLAWSLGKRSLEFFCMYFLQDTFLVKDTNSAAPIADVHREIWDDIEASVIHDGHNQIGRILPRGTGKSVFATFAGSMWAHCYGFKKYTLICSDIGSTAEKFIKDIKNTFLENKYIEKAFGVLLNDHDKKFICNSTQLEFTNKTFMEAISSASPMRGRKYDNCRPDLIILDDYQSEDDVRTEDAREKKWKRYSDDVKYAVQKAVMRDGRVIKQGTTLIAVGTLQHKECFYSRLTKQPTWKFKNERGVLVDDVDEYFNTGLWAEFRNILFDFKNDTHLEDAKEFYWQHIDEMKYPLLWDEFWDCLDMAMSYYENPAAFKQEVQGDINSIGEKWFKTIATEKSKEIEQRSFAKTMLLVDPAATSGKKSDYSAYLVGSLGENNLKYARKAELAKINARTDFDRYIDHMVEYLIKFPEIKHVYIEKNTFNGADANQLETKIFQNNRLRIRNIEIINESQRKNKDDKISTIIPYMNKGQIIFAEEDSEFTDQILDFRGQKFSVHDDAPDITAEFFNRIDEIKRRPSYGPVYIRGL